MKCEQSTIRTSLGMQVYTNTTISMGSVHMLHTLKCHQQARQLSLSCALVIKTTI